MYREVVLVPKEHLTVALDVLTSSTFSGIHRIPYGEFYLLSALGNLNKMIDARNVLSDRGVAFNSVMKNDDSRSTDPAGYHAAVRFNNSGERIKQYCPAITEAFLAEVELLSNMQWPDGARYSVANLRAECIAQLHEWENQVAYGQVYSMMQLLGVEE